MKAFLTLAGVLVSFAAWLLIWRDTARSKRGSPWYARHTIGWLKGLGVAAMGWFALMAFNWNEIQSQERANKKSAIAAAQLTQFSPIESPRALHAAAPAAQASANMVSPADAVEYEQAREAPPQPPPAAAVHVPGETEAWVMAKGFVKNALRSPSTADFGGVFDQSPNCSEVSGSWKCIGWVDAQNGFGATIRNYFSVTIRWTSPGEWADPRSWEIISGPTIAAR